MTDLDAAGSLEGVAAFAAVARRCALAESENARLKLVLEGIAMCPVSCPPDPVAMSEMRQAAVAALRLPRLSQGEREAMSDELTRLGVPSHPFDRLAEEKP